jgi:hypothetical protein
LQPPVSNVEHLRRKAAYVTAQKQQPKRACTYAADILGIPVSTFKSWLGEQKKESHERPSHAKDPQQRCAEPEVVAHIAPPKPRYRIPAISRPSDDHPIIRIVAAGDFHDKPGRCKKRALWIARHIAERNPDRFVSIGDWASFDSLSSHEQPGSQNDADRCPFHEDIESLDESLSVFHRELPPGSLPITITLGNHEARCERAANKQPKLNADLPRRREEIFSRYQWQTHPFGEFVNIAGLDWTHVPLSIMGKEMGGEMMERNVGIKALRSTVCGHTHRANLLTIMKVGQQREIKVLNLGTSMPYKLVEKYTGLAPTGWFYGIHELRVQDGQILSVRQYDMPELESLYGD